MPLLNCGFVQDEQLDVTSEADESMKENTLSSPASDTAEHGGTVSDLFLFRKF